MKQLHHFYSDQLKNKRIMILVTRDKTKTKLKLSLIHYTIRLFNQSCTHLHTSVYLKVVHKSASDRRKTLKQHVTSVRNRWPGDVTWIKRKCPFETKFKVTTNNAISWHMWPNVADDSHTIWHYHKCQQWVRWKWGQSSVRKKTACCQERSRASLTDPTTAVTLPRPYWFIIKHTCSIYVAYM